MRRSGHCLATSSLAESLSTERACAAPSALCVCHLPEVGFAWGAKASPAPLGPGPATPSPPGAPRPRRRALGQTPLQPPSQFFGQGAFGPHPLWALSLYINTRLAAS